MSVRNAAAGQIAMMAAQMEAEAEQYDSIGERGIGDRVKRSAAEVRLAVGLLRGFDGPPAYDIPADTKITNATVFPEGIEVTPQVEDEFDLFGDVSPQFKVGDRVRLINPTTYPVGYEFTVTDVRNNGFHDYVMGDEHGYGVIFRNIELVDSAPLEVKPGAVIVLNQRGLRVIGDSEAEKVEGQELVVRSNETYYTEILNPFSTEMPLLFLTEDEFEVVRGA